MEPAWRQQGRGRGRGHNSQGERSQPSQRQSERPGPNLAPAGVWAGGRGVQSKVVTAASPAPEAESKLSAPQGEVTLTVMSLNYWVYSCLVVYCDFSTVSYFSAIQI